MRINEVNLDDRQDLTFRFRSVEKVLKYKELENTEIYFCPFEQEDDVLEGELNLYWQADEILWDNFFAHYFIVYFTHYSVLVLEDEDKREIPKKIMWQQTRSRYNMNGLINEFLDFDIVRVVKKLVMANDHKISPEEMRLYLKLIHFGAITVIGRVRGCELPSSEKRLNGNWDEAIKKIDWTKTQEKGEFHVFEMIYKEIGEELIGDNLKDWQRWLLLDFPECYFDVLKEMVFPKWYIASFCKKCTDTRNWAQYGDFHRGVCLIFRTHQGAMGRGMNLKTCHEYSSSKGRIIRNHIEPLKEVKYTSSFPAINFFEMLGCIPGMMIEEWYRGSNGTCSKYYIKRNSAEWEEWHHRYWQMFEFLVTNKGEAWHDLAEERIVLEDLFFEDYESDISNRKIQYDFEELQGIIWGYATTEDDKKAIREKIEELCRKNGRSGFPFYQVIKNPANREFMIEKELLLGQKMI